MTIQKVEHVREPDAAGTVGIWWSRRFRSSIQQAILILCLAAIVWFFGCVVIFGAAGSLGGGGDAGGSVG